MIGSLLSDTVDHVDLVPDVTSQTRNAQRNFIGREKRRRQLPQLRQQWHAEATNEAGCWERY